MLSSLSSSEGHKFESLPLGILQAPVYNHKMHGSFIGPAGKRNVDCSACRWLIVMFQVKGNQGHKASVSFGNQLGVSANSTEECSSAFLLNPTWWQPLPPCGQHSFIFLIQLFQKMFWAYGTLKDPLGMLMADYFVVPLGSHLTGLAQRLLARRGNFLILSVVRNKVNLFEMCTGLFAFQCCDPKIKSHLVSRFFLFI